MTVQCLFCWQGRGSSKWLGNHRARPVPACREASNQDPNPGTDNSCSRISNHDHCITCDYPWLHYPPILHRQIFEDTPGYGYICVYVWFKTCCKISNRKLYRNLYSWVACYLRDGHNVLYFLYLGLFTVIKYSLKQKDAQRLVQESSKQLIILDLSRYRTQWLENAHYLTSQLPLTKQT